MHNVDFFAYGWAAGFLTAFILECFFCTCKHGKRAKETK
jgi:hypothetical protein